MRSVDVDTGEVGAAELRADEVGADEELPGHVASAERCVVEVGERQVEARQIAAAAPDVGPRHTDQAGDRAEVVAAVASRANASIGVETSLGRRGGKPDRRARRHLRLPRDWPWADQFATALSSINALTMRC